MDFVAELIDRVKPRRVLAIAHGLPDWAATLGGDYVHIGRWSTPASLLVTSMRFQQALSTAETLRALEALPTPGDDESAFDLVFIDHRHDAESVMSQYNAARRLSAPGTIFLFDDAVPRSIEMARATPSQGWWVGQVWMLRHILSPAPSGLLEILDVGATGIMAAIDCGPIDLDHGRRVVERLERIETFADLQANVPAIAADQAAPLLDKIVSTALAHSTLSTTPVETPTSIKSREVVDEEVVRPRMPAEFIADLSGYDLNLSAARKPEGSTPGTSIEQFEQVYILGGSEFYVDGECFFKNVRYPERALRQIPSGLRYTPADAGFCDEAGNFWLKKEYLKRATPLPAGLFMANPDEIDNWGMWLLYGLPAIEHYVLNAGRYRGLLITTGFEWQRKLVQYMGVEPGSVVPQDPRKPYLARDLTMTRYSFRNLSIPDSNRLTFHRLRHRAMSNAGGASTPKRIFISRLSRSRTGTYRRLVNEEALIDAVMELGFEVVEPESLGFEQQIQLFAGADIVVGLGGAGIFNVVFCREGTKVVTIESTTVFLDSHANIFGSMGLQHGLILGREDRDDPVAEHKRWSIDVDGVMNQLRRFC